MRGLQHVVVLTVGLAVASAGLSAASPQRPSSLSDQRLKALVKRIDARTVTFRASLDRTFDRSRIDDSGARDGMSRSVEDFRQSTDRLRVRVSQRQSNALDVDDVLRRAASIDAAMQRHPSNARAERDWLSVRGDLDELARAYNIAWNWPNPGHTRAEPGASFHDRLTGTYQLENNGHDDPRRAAELAARAVPSAQRQQTYQSLLTRLEAPEVIVIERHGRTVTIASTRASRVTFEADGRDHVERWSGDRTMTTRAALDGEQLVVATHGNRGSDFTVTFDPMRNGGGLLMTRTIDDERLREPVTVRSSYRRLSDQARWSIDASGRRDPYTDTGSPAGDVVVPEGTRFVALLDNALSTTNAREGDVYTMTTRSPSQYEGAVIQGIVSSVNGSGRFTGRAGLTLNLQSIRLRNGRSSEFDGVINTVRLPDGEPIRVDREGTVDTDESQTRKTVERSVIGAALGAIIGAVAGGGKGAAIGAVIGAGGGAGTVVVEGRDQLDLERGTEVTITSGGNRR